MSTTVIITMSASVCAAIITAMLSIGTILGGDLKKSVYRWFLATLLLNTAGACFELAVMCLIGKQGIKITFLLRFIDFLSYAFGSFLTITFAIYFYEYLKLRLAASKKPFALIIFFSVINLLLAAIAPFNEMYAKLDAYNNYYPQDTDWIGSVFPVLSLIMFAAIVLRYMKFLKPKESITLLFYSIAPLACYAIESVYNFLWIAYFGASISLLLVYINMQADLVHKMAEKDAELAESRTAIMLSQIQPHFLYNTLAAIQDLCAKDGKQAEAAVETFSIYLRSNLDSLGLKAPIMFEQELEHIRLYLSLEKKRFRERLQYEFDTEAKDFALPTLTLQPIVENAVRHGVTQRVLGGRVIVRSCENADNWQITVEDDGVGFNMHQPLTKERTHIGISNVRYRLEALCGGSLYIESTPGVGTIVTIIIPKGG